MNREKLDKIAELLNNFFNTGILEDLNKLCQEIGIDPISEELFEKIFDNENIENATLKNIISKVEEQLKIEDEEYFYYKLDIGCIPYIKNEKIKEKYLDKDDVREYDKAIVIASIQNDNKKIELIDKLTDEFDKAIVIASIQNDNKKIELIDKLVEDFNKVEVIQNIKDEEIKIKALDKLTDEDYKAIVIRSIKDEKRRIQLIDKLTNEFSKEKVIQSIKDEEIKIEALDKLTKESIKAGVIESIQNDEKKIELIDKLTNESSKAKVTVSIKDEEIKIETLDKLTDESNKADIIQSIKDEERRIELINKLTQEYYKEIIIKTISKENITEFVKENRERTDDTIKFLLKYCIIDDDILYILSEKLQLNYQQKEIIKKLYTKNDELLETINYKILDEKYNELYDKLSILTSYIDIQEEILNLDEEKYEIFIKALKVHEEKNGEWINFTDKILTNLQEDYKEFIDNLKEIELTEEEIENIGNIISKENILNIKTIEEAKSYEKIKQKVCNSIIQEDHSINLEEYPKINELSNIDRIKLAVLMKVYGQTLNETDQLLNLYGRDIENIEKTDKNADIIMYIQSLKIIKETKNEKLLRNIYEKSETISLDNVYDIEYIENQLKDFYMETYNSKLYEPREEDFIGTEEVEGKEINIYDVGTEFGISLHSVEAFCKSNDTENDYVKNWNRSKTASQGFSTSYIRNDMLAIAPINNVVYGFKKYDEGTLIMSGRYDIISETQCFRPTAFTKIEFLSENTQINESVNYNEMVFSRYNSDGTRKQPDYIVFIKDNRTKSTEKDSENYIWENSKKAASEFGIPIVIVDREKCIESEKSKISEMIGEYAKNPNEKLMQSIMQKFSNNRNEMYEDFSNSAWVSLWKDKGFDEIPKLLSRGQIIENNSQKQKNNNKKTISIQEIQEIYEEISQEEKEQGMTELRKRAKMIMQEKQKNEKVGEDNERK